MTYDTIIFDCDGTLVDSEKMNNLACADALAKNGVVGYPYEYVLNHFGGMTLTDIKHIVEREQGITVSDTLIPDFIVLAHEYKARGLQTVSGAMNAVKELSQSYKVCVASNGERQLVLNSLRMTELDLIFSDDLTFTRIQVAKGKPAPDLFLFAAKQLGSEPRNCIVIEDSPSGVMAGIAAGMYVIGFTGAHHNERGAIQLKDAGAHIICASWDDILHSINSLILPEVAV